MGIGFIFTGPSFILYLPQSIVFMIIGISILGFSLPFNLVPLFPMMMAVIKDNFSSRTTTANDLASGLYTASFGVGTIIGPLLGAYLDWLFGFSMTTDILASFCILMLAVLLILYAMDKHRNTSPGLVEIIEEEDDEIHGPW